MDARRNPEYLRRLIQTVEDFRLAFESFLELHVPDTVGPRGLVPAVYPREDADPGEIERRRANVARLAGRAAQAVPLTNVRFGVAGSGVIDPIAAWHSVAQPKPILEPSNVLDACAQIVGRLEGLADLAEAEQTPDLGAAAFHPAVWGPAARLWEDGHYTYAVAAAADAVVSMVKNRTERNDLPETALWQQAFSKEAPEQGKPRLRWPGDPNDRSVSTMINGLLQFAPGVQMTFRNPVAHGADLEQQDALERLAVLSLLARWVDRCEVLTAEQPQSSSATNT